MSALTFIIVLALIIFTPIVQIVWGLILLMFSAIVAGVLFTSAIIVGTIEYIFKR